MSAVRQQLVAEVKASIPVSDHARDAQEVEFLKLYREANAVDQKRMRKLMRAAIQNMLPPPEVGATMTREEVDAFADSLPEEFAA
ncbi:hypothetical protein [Thermomonas carbonis]|uniref:Uncharacterized protein n=1 Tax=Thermomonas carbonis TaxID=1463158 RepID=A0A7G9SR92_9GAMM|nr:hypothetical protein [Thermomonas carbonis]QNN70367.1 hypothetical protein H9L16_01635 [Thermomonas carbonis]GHB99550.1 hypothetical protein GCM10010080_10500 [Thermomonas carbonis]